jgi:hypothetical protein
MTLATVARRAAAPLGRAVARRNYHALVRDMRFLLHEVLKIEEHHATLTSTAECDRATVDMVVDETAKLCSEVLDPLDAVGDREGCTWVDETTVKTPAGFKEAWQLFTESGWQGLAFPEAYGGQALPVSLALVQGEMIATACWSWGMFAGLSKGCINTLLAHGSDDLKAKYLPPLVAGEFTGTMCLTEPQCGSDLGQLTTRAEPRDDGSYSISGTKIFISCGEHDFTSNIVHAVLARLPDAPAGTKGITLFLVPKRLVDDDGTVGELNGVATSRIEHKMGCHGSPTCQLEFDGAQGWMIGEPHKGTMRRRL